MRKTMVRNEQWPLERDSKSCLRLPRSLCLVPFHPKMSSQWGRQPHHSTEKTLGKATMRGPTVLVHPVKRGSIL